MSYETLIKTTVERLKDLGYNQTPVLVCPKAKRNMALKFKP